MAQTRVTPVGWSLRHASASAAPPAILLDRVGVRYGRGKKVTDALVDFTLRVDYGETVALLGPVGSGTSTALNALAGSVRPTSGAVRLAGRDVTDLPPALRGVGIVRQSCALFPHMSAADNVAFGLRAHKVARRDITLRVNEALEMVGMRAFRKCLPRELSDAHQLRVALARALAITPAVLLLDEPLAAFDRHLRQSMLAELQRLKEALPDTAIVYATGDPADALTLADRIAVVNDARLVDVDTAENLWKRPPSGFTATFLGGANLLPCAVGRVVDTSALVTVGTRTVSAEAPLPAFGQADWEPGAPALLCVRPHVLRVVSTREREALLASVNAALWRGAVTRLVLTVESLPQVLVEVDVPGHTPFEIGSAVGLQLPEPAGVLVPPDGAASPGCGV